MRADKFFAERFGSRTKAKEALAAGRILRNGRPLGPADDVSEEDAYTVLEGEDFVSNGGRKLERAFEFFAFRAENKVFADLGASTGGFTDCLLRHGAAKVYCIDVGESLLDERIAADPRVVVLDKTNARYLTPERFSEPLDGIVSDLSFISLKLVLPAVCGLLGEKKQAVVLFKPQFECGKGATGKSGILPVAKHRALISEFYDFAAGLGLAPKAIVNAPVFPKKNVEYVVLLEKGGGPATKAAFLSQAEKIL